jgi:hypothetical protein
MSTTVTGSPPRGQTIPRRHAAPGGLQTRGPCRGLRFPRADALTGLEAGIAVLALVMAIGCAWGLTRRLAEYR